MRYQIGLGTILTALLLTMLPVGAAAAPDNDRGRGAEHRAAQAEKALDKALGLFQGGRISAQDDRRARRTTPPEQDRDSTPRVGPEHASLVLRDLALRVGDLADEDRKLARSILARPTDGAADPWKNGYLPGTPTTYRCSETADICVHWVTDPDQVEPNPDKGIDGDAPDLTDTDEDGVPDWVEQNIGVFEQVWEGIVDQLGYRPPVPDDTARRHGPDGKTDIYLAELGHEGMYGYCTIDDIADRSAYCVVDDDFAEFAGTPERSLRVTAAHEFFHAVQFAYRIDGDHWLMEGTAAWVEDEVYDHINDNLQYLSRSALRFPDAPLDFVDPSDFNWVYGSWIWWRFLTEHFGVDGRRDPSVVREVWERLATDGPGEGSMTAQRRTIINRGRSFERVFADFGAVNRIPQRWYAEGRSYGRYVAAPAGRFSLNARRPGMGWKATRLSHLSTQHAIIRPGRGLAGPWRLRIRLDLPPRFRGSAATVVVHRDNGRLGFRRVKLDRRGNGTVHAPFNNRQVSHVALSLTNASTRIADCGSGTIWTCGGRPLDDDLQFAFRAKTFKAS